MNFRYLQWFKPRPPSEEELRVLMQKEGLKPFVEVMERDERSDVHSHRYDEVRFLLSGSVEFSAEGRCVVLNPGDRVDIAKNISHMIKNLERGQSVMLCAEKGRSVYVEVY